MNLNGSGVLHPSARCGASLIELMAAMGILSVILLMLSTALEASLGQFRTSTDRSVNRSSGRAALQWMEQDLKTTALPSPSAFSSLPENATEVQREFFGDRLFIPFELDLKQSTDDQSRLPKSAPEYSHLSFATWLDPDFILDPRSSANFDDETQLSLVGYYVAFTRNSPLASDSSASMKLFRHLRPSSRFRGDRYSGGYLLHNHVEVNTAMDASRSLEEPDAAAIRKGEFSNGSLPVLIGMQRENSTDTPVEGSPAWPALPLNEHLASPPPSLIPNRGDLAAWQAAGNPVHETVFPDQPICENVVRFELEAFRRFETSPGVFEILDAAGVNSHLGINGGNEWPCLVVPDYIKITLRVIS